MKRWSPKSLLTQTDTPYYLLSFLGGFCIYILKLASVVKVLDDLGMEFYPWLMLIQGISIYSAIKITEIKSRKNPFLFASLVFLAGLFIVAVGNLPFFDSLNQSIAFPISIFICSSILLSLIEIHLNDIIFSQISLLKNTRIATTLALFEETGALTGSIFTFFVGSLALSSTNLLITLFPFLLSSVLLLLLKPSSESKTEIKEKKQINEDVSLRLYPFSFLVIGLFTTLLCLKQLQGFTVLVGLEQLKGSNGEGLTKIFSQFSMVQTSLIFIVLLSSMSRKSRLPTWSKGIKGFLSIQTFSMGLLVVIPSPLLYLGTGAIRKIWQHTFLEESMNILNSSIPQDIRIKIRSLMERFGNLVAYTILAGVSFLCINKITPMWSAWLLTACIGGVGIFLRKKLFNTLTDYQVGNIVRTDVFESINSCYSLANPEASNHAMALISLMHQNPRPILLKAIIKSLGNMQSKDAIVPLMKIYETNSAEDVQLAAIEALLKFESHDIDYFLLNKLQKIIQEQTSLGEIRRSIFTAITTRLHDVAIPMLVGILKENPEDQRVIANVLIVMGEIAVKRNDVALLEKISEYLAPNYTRRVRANALMFLFHHKKFHMKASSIFGTFLASNDEYDRSAVAFLAGELRLRGMMGFIFENSKNKQHQNSTLLIALLKLGYHEASNLCADLILNASHDQKIIVLNQLSAINNNHVRYKVYFEVLEKHPERLNEFLQTLIDSKRDFDEDRILIHKEAKRLGIFVNEDNQLFESPKKELKAA